MGPETPPVEDLLIHRSRRVFHSAPHQRVRELGRVVVLVRDGNGGRRRSGQAHFASRHVLGHDFQLVSGGRQRLEDTKKNK